jgi:hypothetical protein
MIRPKPSLVIHQSTCLQYITTMSDEKPVFGAPNSRLPLSGALSAPSAPKLQPVTKQIATEPVRAVYGRMQAGKNTPQSLVKLQVEGRICDPIPCSRSASFKSRAGCTAQM